MILPGAIYFFLLFELIFVAIIDIKTKKIWNMWSIVNIAFFILSFLLFSEQYKFGLSLFLFPLGVLVAGFILWMMKIMGAGDAKYLFTFFLLIPLSLHQTMLMLLAYSTILIGLGVMMYNITRKFTSFVFAVRTFDRVVFKMIFGTKFTYAPVILLAWIWLGWEKKQYIFW